MLVAIDDNHRRIFADEADRANQYYCPICGKPVLLRRGQVNASHFAHGAGECTDNWSYDMSAWHRKMQMYFPAEAREVVVTNGAKTHRADVLIGNTVIEMQHSPITAEEFNDRNIFFKKAGYRLVWIFDLRDKLENGQLSYLDCDSDHKYKWSNPMRIFSSLPAKLSDYDRQFAIYLNIADNSDDGTGTTFIERIVWSAGNNNNKVDLSRFVTSDALVLGTPEFVVYDMFTSEKDRRRCIVEKVKDQLKCRCAAENFQYNLKYIATKGKKRDAYVCPRTQKFGILAYGERACVYCRYCYCQISHEEDGIVQRAFYCCYPHAVRQCNGGHPGYECDAADEYPM